MSNLQEIAKNIEQRNLQKALNLCDEIENEKNIIIFSILVN